MRVTKQPPPKPPKPSKPPKPPKPPKQPKARTDWPSFLTKLRNLLVGKPKPPEWGSYRIFETVDEVHAYIDALMPGLEEGGRVAITKMVTGAYGNVPMAFDKPHYITALSASPAAKVSPVQEAPAAAAPETAPTAPAAPQTTTAAIPAPTAAPNGAKPAQATPRPSMVAGAPPRTLGPQPPRKPTP